MSDTLTEARQHSLAQVDALDDPADLENAAIRNWLRQHPMVRDGDHQLVFVDESLPPLWQARAESFASLPAAQTLVKRLSHHKIASQMMRQLVARSRAHLLPLPDDQALDYLADQVYRRQIWVMRSKQKKFAVGMPDESVASELNGKYATKVDILSVARWEGGQILHGYVPIPKKTGIVAGKSGMTIATAFDIGQRTLEGLQSLNLGATINAKLEKYVHLDFKGKTRAEVLQKIASTAPVPKVEKAEANTIDVASFGFHLNSAIQSWDQNRESGVPAFRALPVGWQTVVLSRTFHQGPGLPNDTASSDFYDAATSGKWTDAIQALRVYKAAHSQQWYLDRVKLEADMLSQQLPPPVS